MACQTARLVGCILVRFETAALSAFARQAGDGELSHYACTSVPT